MTNLIAMLAMHYACNQAATQAMLGAEEAAACARNYQMVKVQFLSTEELAALSNATAAQRHVLMTAGYHRFKQFEADNPDIIADAKAML